MSHRVYQINTVVSYRYMLYGSYYNNVCLYLGMRYVTPC